MSDDRTLLELAATAAGFEWQWFGANFCIRRDADKLFIQWSPLTDDGDAFRLAVKLRLTVTYQGNAAACFTVDDDGNSQNERVQPLDSDDPASGVRLAIVRAAAASLSKGGADDN